MKKVKIIFFQKPTFGTVLDESGNQNHHFVASITDAGACMTYNGNSINDTFVSNPKIDNLKYSLDPRNFAVSPNYINGTGRTSQQTLWIKALDRQVLCSQALNIRVIVIFSSVCLDHQLI